GAEGRADGLHPAHPRHSRQRGRRLPLPARRADEHDARPADASRLLRHRRGPGDGEGVGVDVELLAVSSWPLAWRARLTAFFSLTRCRGGFQTRPYPAFAWLPGRV